ncbi:putative nucleotide-diphospho-sugar transferase [Clostridium pasteurianum]|uniref:Nucleotide-diphospho-sugar transferase n=1 Tax=Clostridium pasteurianum BC1 TaxID=86416 RepID=R4KE57_CLOPA|nr:putative nucleotide-diphospho-sugar transferase [Clostridium pasteurianum]AGK97900.1 Nucleotide-diphospho-sugar transferase [Clostridium pasteurianum BC1]
MILHSNTKAEKLSTNIRINESNNYSINADSYNDKNKLPANKTLHFCTLLGKGYVFKVLALYSSLEQHSKNFHIWICCIDNKSYSILTNMNLINATVFQVSDIENAELELVQIKNSRKENQYCWTLKPFVINYVLNNYHVDSIIYCDSDIFFFSDPSVIFDEWSDYSVFICPQRDRDWVHRLYGKYQAGLIGFKKDKNGLESLNWWGKKCIEWCSSYLDPKNERWGDQKYLDKIPLLFSSVKISQNLGLDAAPWNIVYNKKINISIKDNIPYIENYKLVAYHFVYISVFNDTGYSIQTLTDLSTSGIIKNMIYLPYFKSIRTAIKNVKDNVNENINILFKDINAKKQKNIYSKIYNLVFNKNKHKGYYFCTLTSQQYIIRCIALYKSLKNTINNFNLYICCMDDISFSTLQNMSLKNVILIHVNDVENNELLKVKHNRDIQEYSWTMKAPLILYVLKNFNVDSIVYCDSDIFFFKNPNKIFNQWKGHDIFLCKQRVSNDYARFHGNYQAGLIGFRNNKNCYDILKWWKQKCIEWCYSSAQPELGRWGDQKYLDKLPMLFSNIKIINHLGIDAAAWNLIIHNNYKIHTKYNDVYIENSKLIVYHFGRMEIFNDSEFDLWRLAILKFDKNIIDNIYIPYLNEIKNVINELKSLEGITIEDFYDKESIKEAKNFYRLNK